MPDTLHRIVCCSPAGSTRHVAKVIEAALVRADAATEPLELWQGSLGSRHHLSQPRGRRLCLWLGTPVYALHPVPPVKAFLDRLEPCPRECFLCHNCVRLCPEGAITTDTQATEQRIRGLAEYFRESPPSAVFI